MTHTFRFWAIILVILSACSTSKKEPETTLETMKGEMIELNRKLVATNARIDELSTRIYLIHDLIDSGGVVSQRSGVKPTIKLATPQPSEKEPTKIKQNETVKEQTKQVRQVPIDESNATELYAHAYQDYDQGNLDRAIVGFDTFIRQYGDHEYIQNALYWLGECYYDKREYLLAIDQFKRILDHPPSGNKYPDALLKMAFSYDELQDNSQAEKYLSRLIKEFPGSKAAFKAAERLKQQNK